MRGNLPDGLKDLVATVDTLHYTIAASIFLSKVPNVEDGALGRYLYLAASACKIEGKSYDKVAIREAADQSRSIDRQTSQISLQLENITLEMGNLFLKDVRLVQGGKVTVYRWYYENTDGLSFPLKEFTGVISNVSGDILSVKLDLTADIYAVGSFGGGRVTSIDCAAVYSSPTIRIIAPNLVEACGYDGPKNKCNHLLDHADGCTGHGIAHRYQGMSYKQGVTENGAAATTGDLKPPQNYGLVVDNGDAVMAMQPRIKFEGFTVTNDADNRRTVISGGSGGAACDHFAWNGATGNESDDLTTRRVQTFKAERPGTFTDWGLYANDDCQVTVDIRRISAVASYPLDSGDSMPGSGNYPQITSGSAAEGDCSAWDGVEFNQGDIIEIILTAVDTPPKYLAVVLRGDYTGCDTEEMACGAGWTVDLPNWINTDGVERTDITFDAMQQGEALIDADEEGFDFEMHTDDKLAFIGVMGENCPPPNHHELGNYDYWFRGLATQYAAVEFKTDGTYEVWQADEATGVTGSYVDGTGFRIERAVGGADLNVYANGSLVYTTDLLGLDDPVTLPGSLRIVALGGEAGAIVEVL